MLLAHSGHASRPAPVRTVRQALVRAHFDTWRIRIREHRHTDEQAIDIAMRLTREAPSGDTAFIESPGDSLVSSDACGPKGE